MGSPGRAVREGEVPAEASTLRQNWHLLLILYFIYLEIRVAAQLLSDDNHGHEPADLLIGVIMVPLLGWLWTRGRAKREALAPTASPLIHTRGRYLRASMGH